MLTSADLNKVNDEYSLKALNKTIQGQSASAYHQPAFSYFYLLNNVNTNYFDLNTMNLTSSEEKLNVTRMLNRHSAADELLLMHGCYVNSSTDLNQINFSLECFQLKFFNDFKFFIMVVLFVVIIVVDVLANIIVLVSIAMEKTKKRVDLCFMSNAVADLLMGLIIMPFTALLTLFGYFPFGDLVCFMWNCLDFAAGTASMLHLAFISYDRFLSVSKPYKYTQKSSERLSVTGIPTCIILAFIWFFSSAAWIPAILYFKSQHQDPTTNLLKLDSNLTSTPSPLSSSSSSSTECTLNTSPSIVLPHSIIVYYLPMFLIVFFYSKTIRMVNEKMKRRRTSLISTKHNSTFPSYALHSNTHQVSSSDFNSTVFKTTSINSNSQTHATNNNHNNNNTFVQHMKTINLFSIYFLLRPKPTTLKSTGSNLVDTEIDNTNNNNILLTSINSSNKLVDDTKSESVDLDQQTPPNHQQADDDKNNNNNDLKVNRNDDCINSSSFNSTTTSTKISSDEHDPQQQQQQSSTSNYLGKRQFWVSLENDAFMRHSESFLHPTVKKPSAEKKLYMLDKYNYSLNSHLVDKLRSSSLNRLRRYSDLSKLNLNEYEFNNNNNDITSASPQPLDDITDDDIDDEHSLFKRVTTTDEVKSDTQTLSDATLIVATTNSGVSLTQPVDETSKIKVVKNGILKKRNSSYISNREADQVTNKVTYEATTVTAAAAVVAAGATAAANPKIISFKISKDFDELSSSVRMATNITKREKNVTYKLGIIMVTFIVSWLPFSVLWPLNSICPEYVSETLYIVSFWLAYLNSVFTPLILLYNNVKYRRSMIAFKNAFILKPYHLLFKKNNINIYHGSEAFDANCSNNGNSLYENSKVFNTSLTNNHNNYNNNIRKASFNYNSKSRRSILIN